MFFLYKYLRLGITVIHSEQYNWEVLEGKNSAASQNHVTALIENLYAPATRATRNTIPNKL